MSEELLNDDQNSFLELSDDEIMNMDLDQLTSSAEAEEGDEPSEADSGVVEEPETAETENDDERSFDDPADDDDDVRDDSSDSLADSEQDEVNTDAFDGDEAEAATEEEPAQEESEADNTDGINYKAEYEKLLAPFKANGKTVKVDSVDEAIQLMQMGANYNKKMQGLKPNLKLLKMLENNGLLQEDKLNYLIDLDKKNPDAIHKLIKDSGIDPLDVDTEAQTSYKPNSYTVDEREVALDAVLEEIQDTSTYKSTVEVISTKWDEASRKIIVEHPQIIKVINEHMQNGIYPQIEAAMEKERMLGRLNGMSDLEAYRYVGDQIFANGGFSQQSPETPPVKSTPKPTKKADPKVTNRKRAAAPTKSAPAKSAVKDDFNPLSLSDDEFEKLLSEKFI